MPGQEMPYQDFIKIKPRIIHDRRGLFLWLGIVLLALFVLVIVGGATRLTDSGLSITQWKPVHGVIPPLNGQEWEKEFELYKQIPQYQLINEGMSLDQFKTIYWWEWVHRFLARSVGILFAVPLMIFWIRGRIEKPLKLPLVTLLLLGGLQGFIGWWMVSSGLVERVDVSQYRLAVHLTLACIIFAAILWIMRGLMSYSDDLLPITKVTNVRRIAALLTLLIVVQIFLGGLVAGLDAGLAYNTWPLMDGSIVPSSLWTLKPVWLNLFENPKMVQFIHRISAYILWIFALGHMVFCLKNNIAITHLRQSVILFLFISIQALFGIITLILQVPVSWGLIHQAMALIVLGFAVIHWRSFMPSYPVTMPPSDKDRL